MVRKPIRIKPSNVKRSFAEWCLSKGYHDIWQRCASVVINEWGHVEKCFKEKRGTDKQEYYRSVYLKSEHWVNLKSEKLAVDSKCEKCGSENHPDVHHIRYKNLYDVKLTDLMTLCRPCHTKHHETDFRKVFYEYCKEVGIDPENHLPHRKPRVWLKPRRECSFSNVSDYINSLPIGPERTAAIKMASGLQKLMSKPKYPRVLQLRRSPIG